MDYSKMSDFEVNRRVAICVRPEIKNWTCYDVSGRACFVVNENTPKRVQLGFSFISDPADAWPIILENNISMILDNPSSAMATNNCVGWYSDEEPPVHTSNQNPLRAAMIVFLLMQESANVQTDSTR